MYINKFLTFGLSALLELAGGVSYAFSLYSPALKKSLHYTQVQIQGVANPLLPSLLVGVLPGFAYDALQRHNRFGPRFALLLGGFIHGVGYTGLWLVGTQRIEAVPYWIVVALGVVAMNGASWTDVACISANVRNFRHERGHAIGILKSMMGLSASVFTTIYAVTLWPQALSFLLVIAASLAVLALLALPVFNAVPFCQQGEVAEDGAFWSNGVRFTIAYSVVGLLGLFMLIATKLDTASLSPMSRMLVLVGIAMVLSPMLFLGLGSSGFWAKPAVEGALDLADEEASPAISSHTVPLLGAQAETEPLCTSISCSSRTQAVSGEANQQQTWPLEMTAQESLTQLNFWLLFLIFGVGSACGLLFLNNAGQLVESLEGPRDGQDPLLTLFSVLNCFGRLAFGFLPEYALHTWGTPRTLFMVGVSSCMALVTFLTALADFRMLWITSPVCGLVYGAHWSLMPALASEFFGLGHFGLNYCLLGSSITLASFGISNMLGGYIYDMRLEQHGDKANMCIGPDCFRVTFLTAACCELLAVAAGVLLLCRTRYIYHQEQRAILQVEEAVKRSPATGHRLVPQRVAAAASAAQSRSA